MAKRRGYPDRRGMGAESDPISEPFLPNERYQVQQKAMIEKLIAAGLDPEHVARLFSIPVELLSGEKPKDL
ncbi:MAG: hypothetical protein WA708_21020 [Acidobacteriaceae bacterium]